MMNPIWPDAQPWDNILWIAVAVLVVLLNRKTMFQRENGVTDVLLPAAGDSFAQKTDEISGNRLTTIG